MTNKVALQAKQQLFKLINPNHTASKKRNIKKVSKGNGDDSSSESDEDMQIIKDFEHETSIAYLYSEPNEFNIKFIDLEEQCPNQKMYVAIGEKVLLR